MSSKCPNCGSDPGGNRVIGDDGVSESCDKEDCQVSMFVVEPFQEQEQA